MLKKYFLENPEIIRFIKVNFRYPKSISLIILYFICLLSIYGLIYFSMVDKANFETKAFFKVIYTFTLGIEYVAYFYIGSYLVSSAITQEKDKGTFDFLRMTTIDRKVLAIGKLFGPTVFISFLILLTTPFVLLFGVLGNVEPIHFLTVHTNLFFYGIFFQTVALFSGMLINKSSSANSTSLAIPIFFSFSTLSIQSESFNPFYNLFIVLKDKLTYSIKSINFYDLMIPDFIIVATIIFYLVFWFMLSLIRKIDNETNHALSKKQALAFVIGNNFILLGLLWSKFANENVFAILFYFLFNFLITFILTGILTPTKEDIVIYFNKKQDWNTKVWDSKAPIFYTIFMVNIIILVFSLLSIIPSFFITGKPLNNEVLKLLVFFPVLAFSFIYSQIFYLSNLIFDKHARMITAIVIIISFFIPIPLKLFLQSNSEIIDLLIFNPLFVTIKFLDGNVFRLSNITEVIILIILILGLNVLIMSKQEKLSKKYKIES